MTEKISSKQKNTLSTITGYLPLILGLILLSVGILFSLNVSLGDLEDSVIGYLLSCLVTCWPPLSVLGIITGYLGTRATRKKVTPALIGLIIAIIQFLIFLRVWYAWWSDWWFSVSY